MSLRRDEGGAVVAHDGVHNRERRVLLLGKKRIGTGRREKEWKPVLGGDTREKQQHELEVRPLAWHA
jgi:hypothetical protein